jgi:hypothetical protein
MYRENGVMVTLTTDMMFLLFTCMPFGCGEFCEGGAHVHRQPVKRSASVETLRNAELKCSV